MLLRCGSQASTLIPFGKTTHWTSTVELTHANGSALDPRWCSQGPSGPPPAPSSQSVTAERLHSECGSSPQSFLIGEDSPVELYTAFSACLTAPHLVRCLFNFYISMVLQGMLRWISQSYSKDKSCMDILTAKHLRVHRPYKSEMNRSNSPS